MQPVQTAGTTMPVMRPPPPNMMPTSNAPVSGMRPPPPRPQNH